MTQLAFLFLGAPQLTLNGQAIKLDTRKALAMLAYLAYTGQPHRRDFLAGLLWPEYQPENARSALRRTLSTLNKALNGQGLRIRREEIELDPQANLHCDVLAFHKLLQQVKAHAHPTFPCPTCLDWLEQATGLVRGEFLAGFTLRDSLEFDDWQSQAASQTRQAHREVLEQLLQSYMLAGQLEQAIQSAQHLLKLDNLNEEAHRQLMRLYVQAGRRSDSLRQYRACIRILDQELGVAPMEETSQLYQAILENRMPGTSAVKPSLEKSAPLAAPRLATPALVGRASAWDQLQQCYQASISSGCFLALLGEAGIGKSRLAEEFLGQLRSQGAAVLAMRCYEGEQKLAYAPIIEALRTAAAQASALDRLRTVDPNSLAEAARLQPALQLAFSNLPPLPRLDGPGAVSRLLEGLRQVVLALLTGPQPGVLFIDDLHWADTATLTWLGYLLNRLNEMPILVLAAWRTGELAEPLLQPLVTATQRAGTGQTLTLNRLSSVEVDILLQAAGLADLAPRFHQESEGLPFLVVEYLRITQSRDLPAGDPAWPIPEGMRTLVRSRLLGIPETSRQILATAAVIGRSFGFETLVHASGRSEEEVMEGLEALTGREIIREQKAAPAGQPEYDFFHEKVRALVYEETSQVRRRLLHRRVAETLCARPGSAMRPGPSAGLIARHFHLAGQETLAAEYYRLAGEHARTIFANQEAIDAYQNALSLGHVDRAGLYEAIADLQTLSGAYPEAQEMYEKAAAVASSTRDQARLEQKIGELCHRSGAWEQAESHFQAALELLRSEPQPAQQARLLADLSRTAYRRGDLPRARSLASSALEQASTEPHALFQAHNILAILDRHEENFMGALEHLQICLELASTLDDSLARVAALNNLALVHSDHGNYAQAIQLEDEALQLVIQIGDRHREAALLNNLADLYYRAGEPGRSMVYLKRAVTIFAQIGRPLQPEIWKLTEW